MRIRKSALDQFIAESAATMGPTVEDARAEFDAALATVQAAPDDTELVPALRRLAKASTKLAGALPRR